MGLLTPKCEKCGKKSDDVISHRTGKKYCPECASEVDEHYAKLSKIVLSTGGIEQPYEIVQIIMHIGSGTDGWSNAFARTMIGIRSDALKLNCDAIVNIRIEHRIFVENTQTFFSGTQHQQGIEFFAYGTAVKYK